MTSYGTSETPNVVIENPRIRFWAGLVLYGVGILAALFNIFAADTVIEATAQPWVDKLLDAVALLGLVFGVSVSTPNVPRR